MASSSPAVPFSLLRLLDLEVVPSAGVVPLVASLVQLVEMAVVDLLLDEAVDDVVAEFSVPPPYVDVPCLVLARARVRLSVAPVTPPHVPVGRRWAGGVLFPHSLAVAAVRAVQSGLVPAPPGYVAPRRSRRIARLPPVDALAEEELIRRNRRRF